MIVILAGRRIDEVNAKEERFPLKNAERVAEEVRARLHDLGAEVLICAAACGADLIALNEAKAMGIRLRIVLPFSPERFRQTSVVDRPGNSTWNWGALFDEITQQAGMTGNLIVLPPKDDETAAYIAANERILAEAQDLSKSLSRQNSGDTGKSRITALIIWEGRSRGGDDLTAELANQSQELGIPIQHIITLGAE